MKVIAISGHAGHGKDTVAQFLKTELENAGTKVLITHYADLLKYICKTYFDWDGEKDEKGRELLQYVGTDVVRLKDPDFWVDFVSDILTLFDKRWDFVLIPDARFPNEINRLKEKGFDTIHVRVIRPKFAGKLTAEQKAHPSETALDETPSDVVILNEGSLGDLRRQVHAFALQIKQVHWRAVNIQWDIDDEDESADLPSELDIPSDIIYMDEVSDYLSDLTGFCHLGFDVVVEPQGTIVDTIVH